MSSLTPLRADLLVTTALKVTIATEQKAAALAAELNASAVPRQDLSLPQFFESYPLARRALVVQAGRLLLVDRSGNELFYHPNMAFPRLGNLLRGQRDVLIEATDLRPGDSVLDATLGYAAEAILCAYAVGKSGEIQGIEAVPELGVMVREGLQTVSTDLGVLNEAMRRVQVVHLGHHLEFLKNCPDNRYDVVCFDPFFERVLDASVHMMQPLRLFGETSPLLPKAVEEARRIARRRVVVKAPRSSPLLAELHLTERVESRSGKVTYGVWRRS
jgi:hypothetical protein